MILNYITVYVFWIYRLKKFHEYIIMLLKILRGDFPLQPEVILKRNRKQTRLYVAESCQAGRQAHSITEIYALRMIRCMPRL